MSCLRSVYRIPAGIRPCCAVPPASQCELCIEHRRHGDPSGSCGADRRSLCRVSARIACYSHAVRIGLKQKPAGAYASTGCLTVYRMLRRSSSRSFPSRSMATSRSVLSSASTAMRTPLVSASRVMHIAAQVSSLRHHVHAAASWSRTARSLSASPSVYPAM